MEATEKITPEQHEITLKWREPSESEMQEVIKCPICKQKKLTLTKNPHSDTYYWQCTNPECERVFRDIKGKVGRVYPKELKTVDCPDCGAANAMERRELKYKWGQFFWYCTECRSNRKDADGEMGDIWTLEERHHERNIRHKLARKKKKLAAQALEKAQAAQNPSESKQLEKVETEQIPAQAARGSEKNKTRKAEVSKSAKADVSSGLKKTNDASRKENKASVNAKQTADVETIIINGKVITRSNAQTSSGSKIPQKPNTRVVDFSADKAVKIRRKSARSA